MTLERGGIKGFEHDRMVMLFSLMDGGREVSCAISSSAMDDLECGVKAKPDQRDAQFLRLRDQIEQCASRKFQAQEFEGAPPGIILRSLDFRNASAVGRRPAQIDHDRDTLDRDTGRDILGPGSDPSSPQEVLTAENVSLRLLLTQAKLSAETLLAQAGIDAKEREASDKLQKLILEELHHRIKNTLATVSAIASQSLRNASSTQHAQQAIEGRLQALGRAHDLLLQARWSSADLQKIVRGAIEAFDNPDVAKFTIEGPDVRIASGAVIAIAMTLNELCTNTTKFGALSVPSGRVAISWVVDAASRLQFTWNEQGGPIVKAPTRQSFGTRLIEMLGRQFQGEVRLSYEPGGFVYVLDVPLAALTA